MPLSPRAPRLWRCLFWPCVLAVLVLSLIPPEPYVPTTGWDKSNHMLGFAVLMMTGWRAYPAWPGRVWLGLLAFGGLIEILQSFTGYRSAEWLDLLADAVGLVLGFGAGLAAARMWPAGRQA